MKMRSFATGRRRSHTLHWHTSMGNIFSTAWNTASNPQTPAQWAQKNILRVCPCPLKLPFSSFFPPTASCLDSLHFCVSPSCTTHTKPNHKVNVGRGLPYEAGVSISPAWPWASSVPWQLWSHPEALTQSHRSSGTRRANAAGSEPHVAAVCQRAVSNLQRVAETQLPGSHIFPPAMYPHTYTESESFFFPFSYSHPPKKNNNSC